MAGTINSRHIGNADSRSMPGACKRRWGAPTKDLSTNDDPQYFGFTPACLHSSLAVIRKVILHADPETGEGDAFVWAEDHEPPPVIRPRRPKEPKDVPGDREEKKE